MSLNGSSEALDALRSDIDALRSDFSSISKDIGELRKAGTHEARERIAHTAAELRKEAVTTLEDTRKTFQQHPLAYMAGAFGLGLIISRLL